MLIDWFTVAAQMVNFLILVWLLKRFLYSRILNALDAREKRIAAELADALAKKNQAEKEHKDYSLKNEEFAEQRIALFDTLTLEARAERQRLFEKARTEAEDMRVKLTEALNNDFRNIREELIGRSRDEIFAIARKTLTDLASAGLEEQMAGVFIHRCRTLTEEERGAIQAVIRAAGKSLRVRSTFALSAELQKSVEHAVREVFAIAGKVEFETSPELISGIELSVDGHEVSWSIAEYLQALEANVRELLPVPSGPQPEPGASGHGI